jgi:hypothetical protein
MVEALHHAKKSELKPRTRKVAEEKPGDKK